jgi:NADPH-dependent curcumin reductase CurA
MKNKQVLLASRPSGWFSLDNFTVTEGEVGEPGNGEVLRKGVRVHFSS